MPPETDPARLLLLRQAFADTASNVPGFSETATTGGHRRDEGLLNLLPGEPSEADAKEIVKRSIVAFLDAGGRPNVVSYVGDENRDPARFYEFRLTVLGHRLYVKVLMDEVLSEPDIRVISVKRHQR